MFGCVSTICKFCTNARTAEMLTIRTGETEGRLGLHLNYNSVVVEVPMILAKRLMKLC
jgi:hypothetical protein